MQGRNIERHAAGFRAWVARMMVEGSIRSLIVWKGLADKQNVKDLIRNCSTVARQELYELSPNAVAANMIPPPYMDCHFHWLDSYAERPDRT